MTSHAIFMYISIDRLLSMTELKDLKSLLQLVKVKERKKAFYFFHHVAYKT